MKKSIIFSTLIASAVSMTGCYKMQKDYQYNPQVLDPNIRMTAKEYLLKRADDMTTGKVDTVFRWMRMAIDYSGIDISEYEKPGRTYIFLHNNAVRTLTSNKVTAGFFFDNPIVVKDVNGVNLKSKIDPTQDSTRPAVAWSEYSKTTVKNYLLSLILDGTYSFDNLTIKNVSAQSLLPAGTIATKESKLGYIVVQPTPDPSGATTGVIVDWANGGKGFDPEGKMNLVLVNNTNSPIRVNDRTDDRTAGYVATNGYIHVYDKTVWPFRYSY